MRYLSLCSGIEAASVAWHPLGWRAVAFSEIDPFPCAVLAHHYPDVPNLGDMTRFEEWPDADFDVLVGGTPCQSFSVAGLRGGLADPRGNLMLTFGAIARRYRPEWLVWENVPGVLSSNGGRDFGTFLGMLGELGYGFAYRVLDAKFFGVAQRRRRVFVVANARDWRRAAAVLFERASLRGDPAPSREARKDTSGSTGDGVARCITTGESKRQDWETCNFVAGVAPTLQAGGNSTGGDRPPGTTVDTCDSLVVTHSLRAEGFDAGEGGTGRGTQIVPVAFDTTQITSKANRSNPQPGDACHPLAAGAHAPAIAFAHQAGGKQTTCGYDAEVGTAPTLAHGQTPAVHHGMAVRRLTPTECARLQGFQDSYLDITYRGKPAADGPKYRALGNSMAVPCMAWIGRRIEAVSALDAGKVAA